MDIDHVIYLFTDRFHCGDARNEAVLNVCVQVCVWLCIFISLENGTAGS